MSYFQNVFFHEFLGDRHVYLNYRLPVNIGRGNEIVVSWGTGPFDLSGNDADSNQLKYLNINYNINSSEKVWNRLSVDLTTAAASASAVKINEIVDSLNNNSIFSNYFIAVNANNNFVQIKQKLESHKMKFYIENGQAETKLLFNLKAPVFEMHSDFEKHLISNRFQKESMGILLKLSTSLNVDRNLIINASDEKGAKYGYDPDSPTSDSSLLRNLFV
jgi:hypothetical protein